jgi:Saxitoxin biosynthesis operon protein SxtJ
MRKGPKNPERAFGMPVGIVLCVIAAVLWWRGRTLQAEVIGGVGAVLMIAGLMYPAILKYPAAWWWRLAGALGYVNTRILLTVLFWVVLVPLSLVWRITGKDPLARRRRTSPGWVPYPERYRDRKHYERMY